MPSTRSSAFTWLGVHVDTAGAMLKYDIVAEWTDVSLELYTQAVLRVPFVCKDQECSEVPQSALIICVTI
jgi:hypothetical protein